MSAMGQSASKTTPPPPPTTPPNLPVLNTPIFQSLGQNITGGWSDRRLKKNIKSIGLSPKGLKIYTFEYIDDKYGNGTFQGVMSDEVPAEAVIKGVDGYDRVNYSLLDVEFKQI
jgi:hypothetical protein